MARALAICMVLALAVTGAAVAAEKERGGGGGGARTGEPHAGPRGYQRPVEPHGWNARPSTVDRGAYQHNYQAGRHFSVGPYSRPNGWVDHRWAYGEILPPAYWAPQYVIGDYWLFGLEIPPLGYEWVRCGADAILVNTVTGEILQVEYGVFA
jgi:Ni/Co efflux regulator RcnB